jgi:alkaline phosphatase D
MPLPLSRRDFMHTGAAAGALAAGTVGAPCVSLAASRPRIAHGIQSGDVGRDRAVVWARADRPARLIAEIATRESFAGARTVVGPAALDASDFTAKLDLRGLPAGQTVFYRLRFQDLSQPTIHGPATTGRFKTAPSDRRDLSFVWSGDTAGQGWGINRDWGGFRGYAAMARERPDFFIHSGDTIYADGPIPAEIKLPDGTVWKNVTTEEKSKVAETLHEFRGNFKYNLLDDNVRAFNAAVPIFAQWDDHETLNNWYPGEMLDADKRYTVKSVSLLSARANRAFREFMPMRQSPVEAERVYRKVGYGPLLDIFFLDMRSYRGPNGANNQTRPGPDTAFLGATQVAWLKRELKASTATWKVIAADMPIGIIVYDNWRDKSTFENLANGDGPPRGRELEFADLLRFMKRNRIRNTVWLTADVHYTAAHYYDPNKAQFQDFDPFWEFVSGPIHAGSFGPGAMDDTFGPVVKFAKDPGGKPNLPPSAGLQFYGQVAIEGKTGVMTVRLKDIENRTLHTVELTPQRA